MENLQREQHIEGSSDRSFGLVMAAAFLIIACWPLLHHGPIRIWAIIVATVFGTLALAQPRALTLLNRFWMKLGILLGKIVSPIALGILFYLVITPIGLIARIKGSDPLRLKLDPESQSYWIPRTPPGPPPGSLDKQF